ncbi:surface antigen-domain-containing protein [Umbelopsis sp. PMI_123]|nr:surface antigen-domain-containing protein [Umbelopsis sp. PMI_123]
MSAADPSKTFQDISSLNSETPLHVSSLRVVGTGSTRTSFLNSVTSGIFRATTLQQVVESVQDAADKLRRHDIFSNIEVVLDTAKETTDAIDVVLKLEEKGRTVVKTNAEISDNEANVNGNFVLRNLFGGAETFGTSVEFGNRNKAAFKSYLSTPVKSSPDAKLVAHISGRLRDNTGIASYEEFNRNAGVAFKAISKCGFHELGYNATWRDTKAQNTASANVKDQAGQSFKTAITHSFIRDRRDNATLPTQGHYLALHHELAGVGTKSDSSYFKKELAAQVHHRLWGPVVAESGQAVAPLVLSGGFRAGLIASLDKKEPHISDRFILGGPTSIRGFKLGGIGPRDGDDAAGGEAYWAAGLSAVAAIPGIIDKPIKAHAFINAGNLIKWSTGTSYNETKEALLLNPRISYGVGLIFHHPAARVEANFCFPVQFSGGDLEQAGFQAGFGINFL